MSNLTPPPKGSIYLFDYMLPPLEPGSYRMEANTDVAYDPGKTASLGNAGYFDVVGPRFMLNPDDIAGVFPPRNGHGPFSDSLAQCVLRRRTLPWERHIDTKANPIKPSTAANPLPASYPIPWMALLLFEEGEYTLMQNVPLEQVLPSSAFKDIGSPQGITCDAVEADDSLIRDIMPSLEELQLLTHVRWVNIEDKELSVEGSDGWFSVVVGSRVPSSGVKCRACLVSLEGRKNLVASNAPPSFLPAKAQRVNVKEEFEVRDAEIQPLNTYRVVEKQIDYDMSQISVVLPLKTRLVLLYSWQFTCEGPGSFFDLMQGLDVGMIGKSNRKNLPQVTDTGHIKIQLGDRSGAQETALYRGPLVPFPLTRDTLGPYHSADQARRATPEAGVEDISYAAAFEVGRLLTAADGRLAQELMRWRRESYRQAARADTLIAIQSAIALDIPPLLEEKLQVSLAPILASAAVGRFAQGAGPIADRYGIGAAAKAPGMDAAAVKEAWGLASLLEAQVILGADGGALGIEIPAVQQTPRPNVTLDSVAADASITQLAVARDRMLNNVKVQIGGK